MITQMKAPQLVMNAILYLSWCCNPSLGLATKARACKSVGQERSQECERVWEWTVTLPNELPFWKLESRWTPETLENDCKGQNPSPWGVLYIIGNLLKHRCPKWACMTHLDICNTNYGQKKRSRVKPNHRKSGINPIPSCAGGMRHTIRKLLARVTTSLQTSSQWEVCTRSYSLTKSREFQFWRFRDSHLGVPG
jgi:hypothetical protein